MSGVLRTRCGRAWGCVLMGLGVVLGAGVATAGQRGRLPVPTPLPGHQPQSLGLMPLKIEPGGTSLSLTPRVNLAENIERMRQARFAYTNRPILLVGTLLDIRPASRTLRLAVDARASTLPQLLLTQARRIGTLDQLLAREFPPERSFHWTAVTRFVDGRPQAAQTKQVEAVSGRIHEDPQWIRPDDLRPGERVGVFYRMSVDPQGEPTVLTVSRLDPNQTGLEADFNPLGAGARIRRQVDPATGRTTTTVIRRDPPRAP